MSGAPAPCHPERSEGSLSSRHESDPSRSLPSRSASDEGPQDDKLLIAHRPSPIAHRRLVVFVLAVIALTACRRGSRVTSARGGCDANIKLPDGFCATVFAESAGPVRHIVVRSNGDVIAGVLNQRRLAGGILVLRDTNHDGHADLAERVGEEGVHGVALGTDSSLYASTTSNVYHYRFSGTEMHPIKRVDTMITGLSSRSPPSHSLAVDGRNNLIVTIGGVSTACQLKEEPSSPGRDPCPELETAGGIWSFHTDRVGQRVTDGTRIATGLHNAVALTFSARDTAIYAASHGRDNLHEFWPELYDEEAGATRVAEEFIRIASIRADYGWPYCYYDYVDGKRVLAPEYSEPKPEPARCDRHIQPLIPFPAHWSPMSIVFYTGKMFPEKYRNGAFIAFHGSAYRAPLPQEGYNVVFVAFKDGLPFGDYETFADGFAGGMLSPEGAVHRPVGLAQGPDGSLYVSDDKGGRIWKITYKPE
jgi:glucose/arabinose dehydrogenase